MFDVTFDKKEIFGWNCILIFYWNEHKIESELFNFEQCGLWNRDDFFKICFIF